MFAVQYPWHMDVHTAHNLQATGQSLQEKSDEDLMMAYAQDNDQQAFASLYARHKGSLYRYCVRMLGNEALGAELFQDAWSKVIKARERYQPTAKFTTYLFHVAHNLVIDQWRKKNPDLVSSEQEEMQGTELVADTNLVAEALDAEKREQFRNAVLQLPPLQRDVVLLHYDQGLTLEQIADMDGCGRETIKSRLRYAVKKLKQAISDTSEVSHD